MAMRPDVRRHTIVIIVFSLAQWFLMRYILANELLNITTNQRILYFCINIPIILVQKHIKSLLIRLND